MKYKHTIEDSVDDSLLIQEFSLKFLKRFEKTLNLKFENIFRLNEENQPLGYGASSTFFLDAVKYKSKVLEIDSKPFVKITTEINPNGIDSTGKVGRTFTIYLDLSCKEKRKGIKYLVAGTYSKFYSYSESMDDILNEFDGFVRTTYQARIDSLKQK